mmetsp:Transcript_110494/g.311628  ORF Transcript_110494/g.311628 Transcript_110494/m.311628 type:complete len:394 (+) Transcript_110494:1864-3045(+)
MLGDEHALPACGSAAEDEDAGDQGRTSRSDWLRSAFLDLGRRRRFGEHGAPDDAPGDEAGESAPAVPGDGSDSNNSFNSSGDGAVSKRSSWSACAPTASRESRRAERRLARFSSERHPPVPPRRSAKLATSLSSTPCGGILSSKRINLANSVESNTPSLSLSYFRKSWTKFRMSIRPCFSIAHFKRKRAMRATFGSMLRFGFSRGEGSRAMAVEVCTFSSEGVSSMTYFAKSSIDIDLPSVLRWAIKLSTSSLPNVSGGTLSPSRSNSMNSLASMKLFLSLPCFWKSFSTHRISTRPFAFIAYLSFDRIRTIVSSTVRVLSRSCATPCSEEDSRSNTKLRKWSMGTAPLSLLNMSSNKLTKSVTVNLSCGIRRSLRSTAMKSEKARTPFPALS